MPAGHFHPHQLYQQHPQAPPPPQHHRYDVEAVERDRILREREKQMEREKQQQAERGRERELLEQQRASEHAAQAVQKHFEESLRRAQQKHNNMCWNLNLISSLPAPPADKAAAGAEQARLSRQQHDRAPAYYPAPAPASRTSNAGLQKVEYVGAQAVVTKLEYPPPPPHMHHPPPAHSRSAKDKPSPPPTVAPAALPKAEPNFGLFGYPSYQGVSVPVPVPQQAFLQQHQQVQAAQMEKAKTSPTAGDNKSSVIVKNDGKHSPKFAYRSPSQSPAPLVVRHSPSPGPLAHEPQNLGRPQPRSPLAFKPAASVQNQPPHYRPKVSSPAPPHMYGKPGRDACSVLAPPRVPSPYAPAPVASQGQPPPAHGGRPSPSQPGPVALLAPPPPAPAQPSLYFKPGPSPARPPPTAAPAPSPPPQTAPLDLGVERSQRTVPVVPSPSASPPGVRRKAEPSPPPIDGKRRRRELLGTTQEPSPPIASAATTTTAQEMPGVTAVPSPLAPSPAVSPAPGTPSRPRPPSAADSEKSSSPGPPGRTYPVHKLKKAWLQRHSGEKGELSGTTTPLANGHVGSEVPGGVSGAVPSADSSGGSDADSRDQGSPSTPPAARQRKPPDVKRKRKKGEAVSDAGSGCEAEGPDCTDREKDKLRGNGVPVTTGEEPRKRGRRPRPVASESPSGGTASSARKEETANGGSASGTTGQGRGARGPGGGRRPRDGPPAPRRDPLRKPPVAQLKRTGESFLQDGPCHEVAPKLAKCRECRWTPSQRSRDVPNIFCRFYAFRRLRYTKNGQLAAAGFSDPRDDPAPDDLRLWLPDSSDPPTDLDLEMAKVLLEEVGDQFCDLLRQESDSAAAHAPGSEPVAWKRVVRGVREMCDVCETTLFNYHWACAKCGFAVCIDCYKSRKAGKIRLWAELGKDRDDFSWLLCTNRQGHEQDKLMLTQIIAGDCMTRLGREMHQERERWGLKARCTCAVANGVITKESDTEEPGTSDTPSVKREDSSKPGSEDTPSGRGHSTLRELLIRPTGGGSGSRATSPAPASPGPTPSYEESQPGIQARSKFGPRHPKGRFINCKTDPAETTPPHRWLCDRRLLMLMDPTHKSNQKMFQEQWKKGLPVIVSDVSKHLDMNLWHPDSFVRDFGDEKNDLVNCMTGNVVPKQPMRRFWEGFEHLSRRLLDDQGKPMLLKLKDWPPGDDFAEMLPSRYLDLMRVLPLSEYTHRSGRLNLASRLPECFVRPDLGPKMYNAYGSALHSKHGTTNLHLDISDAVNVMVYVSIPKDGDSEEHIKEAFRAIDEAGCDVLTRRRVREKGALPGALWHIYSASDADKIRDMLNKVALERGVRLEPHHDPIHDQSWYLDAELRNRLIREYGVEGFAIVQCLGDCVFIPAGAPHQVRNLHNCIKVAEDFVSPENISHCFHLTQEFRDLSDTHSNHEDKLQIKNIIYHTVKDSVSVLAHTREKNEYEKARRVKKEPGSPGRVSDVDETRQRVRRDAGSPSRPSENDGPHQRVKRDPVSPDTLSDRLKREAVSPSRLSDNERIHQRVKREAASPGRTSETERNHRRGKREPLSPSRASPIPVKVELKDDVAEPELGEARDSGADT